MENPEQEFRRTPNINPQSELQGTVHAEPVDVDRAMAIEDRTADDERDAAEERARAHDLTPAQRLERLETVCAKYFGTDHFEVSKDKVFNPDAERDDARKRFQAEMERIETAARAK